MKLIIDQKELFEALREYVERRGFTPGAGDFLSLHTELTADRKARVFWAEARIEVSAAQGPNGGPYR